MNEVWTIITRWCLNGWRGWAIVLIVYVVQGLTWISVGAMLAHEVCGP